MKRNLISICVLLFIAQLNAGEYSDAFLNLDVSARTLSMGNATGALDTLGTCIIANPAGLAFGRNAYVGGMYNSVFGLANHNYLGMCLPVSRKSAIAASWIRFSVDGIPIRPDIFRQVPDPSTRRDSVIALSQNGYDSFGDRENAVFLSFGRYQSKEIDLGWRYARFTVEIPWGFNIKLLHKQFLDLTGYGIGVDFGGRLRFSGEDVFDIRKLGRLSMGIALKDITGTTIYWNTKKQDRIPLSPVLSAGLEQAVGKGQVRFNLGIEKNLRYDEKMRAGIEIAFRDCVFIRGGTNRIGLSAGIGFRMKLLEKFVHLDYAFMSHDLGATHRIGGGIEL